MNRERLLFCRTRFGVPVLAVQGEAVLADIAEISADCMDLMPSVRLPRECGLYIWEGTLTVENVGHPMDPMEPDTVYRGTIRPATAEDLQAFGIALGRKDDS